MDTDIRTRMGRVGIWGTQLRDARRPEVRDAVEELDGLGWRTWWLPGLDGSGALDDLEALLVAASHGTVATGVLNIWGQSAPALSARIAELDAAYGARTVVGLGVGSPAGASARGQEYGRPVATLGRYLDELGESIPVHRRLLGALGPRMVDLAVARTAGWHPFLVTPEYVAGERSRVGAGPFLAPHQAVVLDTDPVRARATARAEIGMYLGFPTYRANLGRLGFTADDLVPGGSDRLIDALVAHGTVDVIARRVHEHLDAGADHVALHVLGAGAARALPLAQWRELAQTFTH